MIENPPSLTEEINAIKNSVLKSTYEESLSSFLTAKDLSKLSIKFDSPNLSRTLTDQVVWKSFKISYGSMIFSCRLQSFPGCCGYLVMSGLYRMSFPQSFMEPVFKSIFNFSNSLHYQCIFTSHTTTNTWYKILKSLFDDARETGKNIRTGNNLVLFSKNTSQRLPAQIYTLPELDNEYE